MITFAVRRTQSDAESTIGEFFGPDGVRRGFTLEDAFHWPKIPGKTRIPPGRYKLKARGFGDSHFDLTYRKKLGAVYRGMVEIAGVPNYTAVEVHTGNVADDTDGCVLVGQEPVHVAGEWFLPKSLDTFKAIYPELRDAAESGEGWIEVSGDEPATPPLVA